MDNNHVIEVYASSTRPGYLADILFLRLAVNPDGNIVIRAGSKDMHNNTRWADLAIVSRGDLEDMANYSKKLTAQVDALANFKAAPVSAIKAIREMTDCDLSTAKRIVEGFLRGA